MFGCKGDVAAVRISNYLWRVLLKEVRQYFEVA
jgi:hypothetical protein